MLTRRHAWLLLFVPLIGLVAGFVGCTAPPDPWEGKPAPHILVSVPPLYSFVKSVGGDHVAVQSLCTTSGPHQFVATPADTRLLNGATLFFTVGLGLDDKFCDRMVEATGKQGLLVKLGGNLPADLKRDFADEPGTPDPHVWNATPQAIAMVEQIRDQLAKVDPAHKDDYDQNAEAYIKKLRELHDKGLQLLKDKKDRKIISFHESLGYFAREFDIDIVDVIEVNPGSETDPQQVRDLVQKCIDKDVYVIAVEPQYPAAAAELIKDEVKKATKGAHDVKLVELDPLETAAEKDLSADLYTKTMLNNLKVLADNLK